MAAADDAFEFDGVRPRKGNLDLFIGEGGLDPVGGFECVAGLVVVFVDLKCEGEGEEEEERDEPSAVPSGALGEKGGGAKDSSEFEGGLIRDGDFGLRKATSCGPSPNPAIMTPNFWAFFTFF